MRKINLCKGCIEDLKEHNPYIEEVEIIEVDMKHCDNFLLGKVKKSKKYICDYCGKNLTLGDIVYHDSAFMGICCSLECFNRKFYPAYSQRLTDELYNEYSQNLNQEGKQ